MFLTLDKTETISLFKDNKTFTRFLGYIKEYHFTDWEAILSDLQVELDSPDPDISLMDYSNWELNDFESDTLFIWGTRRTNIENRYVYDILPKDFLEILIAYFMYKSENKSLYQRILIFFYKYRNPEKYQISDNKFFKIINAFLNRNNNTFENECKNIANMLYKPHTKYDDKK